MRLPNKYDLKSHEREIYSFLVGLVLLSIVFAIFSQSSSKKKLGVYSNSDKVETFSEATTETKPINTTQYEDTKAGFALNIPSDWKRINQDGTTMFVHQPSASSVTIKISDYDPSVNNTTSESLSESIAGQGKTFVNFVKNSTSNYQVSYQDLSDNTYDYVDDVYWSRDYVVTLQCVFNDQNYKKILPYYDKILSSFQYCLFNTLLFFVCKVKLITIFPYSRCNLITDIRYIFTNQFLRILFRDFPDNILCCILFLFCRLHMRFFYFFVNIFFFCAICDKFIF